MLHINILTLQFLGLPSVAESLAGTRPVARGTTRVPEAMYRRRSESVRIQLRRVVVPVHVQSKGITLHLFS